MRVLVTYASAHGSTGGIAECIAMHIRASGIAADCLPIHDVESPAGFDAVVVGSAIHDQAWLPEASQFLATHAAELVRMPVWLYSVGMPGALARPLRKMAMREGPKAVAPFTDIIRPRDTRLFSGIVSKRQFPLRSRAVLRLMGGQYGDFRDWHEIGAWAGSICHDLLGGRIDA
ncbi:MAG TPA: flavodoxin domain-containing protein [Acidothermaceae bacterium]|nr:flavodoxin domain-containing protein [Acidothermaceae bacterium]